MTIIVMQYNNSKKYYGALKLYINYFKKMALLLLLVTLNDCLRQINVIFASQIVKTGSVLFVFAF